ncbi:MAG: hypothetical protein IJD18_05100 [Clostridia bacterium]|nr:hypothetical protein [Clostridia bacterium]
MVMSKIKRIVQFAAILVAAIAGLAFVLWTDFALENRATWLLFAIVTAIGCAVCIAFSQTLKDKPVLMCILVVVAIVCAVLFVVVIGQFAQMPNFYGNAAEGTVGASDYMTKFNLTQRGDNIGVWPEGFPKEEMPKYLEVINVDGKLVCQGSMMFIKITHDNVQTYNTICTTFTICGYVMIALSALYFVMCLFVDEDGNIGLLEIDEPTKQAFANAKVALGKETSAFVAYPILVAIAIVYLVIVIAL